MLRADLRPPPLCCCCSSLKALLTALTNNNNNDCPCDSINKDHSIIRSDSKPASLTETSSMSFPGRAVQTCWHLVDASEQTVGRLAAQVAPLLKGKHKPTFMPNKDVGDVVVIVNAEKIAVTSDKSQSKIYYRH